METTEPQVAEAVTHESSLACTARALDALTAVLEVEFQTAEAVGISRDEQSSYLCSNWSRYATQRLSNISGMPASPFQTVGQCSALEQLRGLAGHGRRASLIATHVPACSESDSRFHPAPYLVHVFAPDALQAAAPHHLHFIARSPQEAADLALIARRTAEKTLAPAVVFHTQEWDYIHYRMLYIPEPHASLSYLGRPDDFVQVPDAYRPVLEMKQRRRVPDNLPANAPELASAIDAEAAGICLEAMNKFRSIFGREYNLIDTQHVKDAEVVLLACAEDYNFLASRYSHLQERLPFSIGLLHPTMLVPFPGGRIAELAKNKRALVVFSSHAVLADRLQNELHLAMDKAMANGAFAGAKNRTYPYPGFPAFTSLRQRPQIFAVHAESTPSDLNALESALKNIHGRKQSVSVLTVPPAAPEKHKARRGQEIGALHLLLCTSRAHILAQRFTERIHSLLKLKISTAGRPLSHLIASEIGRAPEETPRPADAEIMLVTEPEIPTLARDILNLKSGGAIVLRGEPDDPEETWATLSAQVHKTFYDKKLRLFLVGTGEPARGSLPAPDSASWHDGIFFGAFLQLMQTLDLKMIEPERIQAAVEFLASNCDLRFAEAVRYGMHNLVEVDYTQYPQRPEIEAEVEEPFMPREEAEPEKALQPEALKEKIKQQWLFFWQAEHPAPALADAAPAALTPANLFAVKNLERIRYAFPLCVVEDAAEQPVLPLVQIFDALIEKSGKEGDDQEQYKRHLLFLEKEIKRLAEAHPGEKLSTLWDRAAAVLKEQKVKSKETLAANINQAGKQLELDGRLIGCDPRTPEHVLRAVWRAAWAKKAAPFTEEIADLSARLAEILQADFAKSPDSHTPASLKAEFGAAYEDEIQIDEFARMMDEKPEGEPLDEKRRSRILVVLKALNSFEKNIKTLLENVDGGDDNGGGCVAALGKFQASLRKYVEYFRATQIARLEVENKYDDEKHDAYFAGFELQHLTPDEIALLPPEFIILRQSELTEQDRSALLELLSQDLPLRIIFLVDELYEPNLAAPNAEFTPTWATGLARAALNYNNVFVLQAGISHLHTMLNDLQVGLQFSGTALFSIYTGSRPGMNTLPRYLDAAAAMESRVFPAFVYNPTGGESWADRFSIAANPEIDAPWPSNKLVFESDTGETSLPLPFTCLDYLATDVRFRNDFLPLPRAAWHEDLMPLDEYLTAPAEDARKKMPYILMVAENGVLVRTIVAHALLGIAQETQGAWRLLQELGGVDNSHAQRLLAAEKQKLAEEKQAEIESIKQQHQAELEKAVGELAEEIVANIAGGLLGQAAGGPTMPAAMPLAREVATEPAAETAPATEAQETAVEAEPEEEEEEEVLSLDEPYIESPRCTSCNECTNLNSLMFGYNENKQAYIKDASAGTYRELVTAAEKCPVHIIHPGKPLNPEEPGLDELMKRAEPYL